MTYWLYLPPCPWVKTPRTLLACSKSMVMYGFLSLRPADHAWGEFMVDLAWPSPIRSLSQTEEYLRWDSGVKLGTHPFERQYEVDFINVEIASDL